MNIRFVLRGLILSLVLTVALVAGWFHLQGWLWLLPNPAPPPPTIVAPRGDWPEGVRAFEEWAHYADASDNLAGSGFLLALADGQVVGVTTAHSVSLGDPVRPLERIGFKVAGAPSFLVEFSRLHGPPGVRFSGSDMTVDYVLLETDQTIDARWVLHPDGRGAPQPGERVTLCSGLGDGNGPRLFDGSVQTVDAEAVWVTMDRLFAAGSMSGSPFVSRHTGQVVGMLTAGTLRGGRLLLGAHPIGSLVRRATAATDSPALQAYRR